MYRRIPEPLRNLPPEAQLDILRTRLFLDIQTLPLAKDYHELPAPLQALWERKAKTFQDSNQQPSFSELWIEKAALYAEFSRIITIGVGYLYGNHPQELRLRCTALYHNTEKELLQELLLVMSSKRFNIPALALVAHNGRDFDYPFLCRRLLLNSLPIPFALETKGKKPYELQLEDTMDMWRFGERRSFVSLRALALLFGLEEGFNLPDFKLIQQDYFQTKKSGLLAHTAREDVQLTAQIYLLLHGLPALHHDMIELR